MAVVFGRIFSLNERRIEELREKIQQLRDQFPAHTIPPAMMAQLDELEDELDELEEELKKSSEDAEKNEKDGGH